MDFLRDYFEQQLDFSRDDNGNVRIDDEGNLSIGETPVSPVNISKSR